MASKILSYLYSLLLNPWSLFELEMTNVLRYQSIFLLIQTQNLFAVHAFLTHGWSTSRDINGICCAIFFSNVSLNVNWSWNSMFDTLECNLLAVVITICVSLTRGPRLGHPHLVTRSQINGGLGLLGPKLLGKFTVLHSVVENPSTRDILKTGQLHYN